MTRAIEQLRQAMEVCELGALTLPDQIDALMDAARAILQEAPTLTPPNEWVSVEDELPEKNAQVLMWSAKWNIAEAGSYYNGRFWVYSEIGDGYIAENITHWMPLPTPPDRRPPEGEA